MPLTQKAIDELKEIYRTEFGEELPEKEAWEMGHRLLSLFDIILKPPPKDNQLSQKTEYSNNLDH